MILQRMLIPEYWAESRLIGEVQGRTRVARRFGWSEDSQEAAERHAEERAAAAMAAMQRGERVPTRDRRLPYGDDEGLPIREQVIVREGDLVVTRNSYGARCLNQPDVLFADVDLVPRLPETQRAVLQYVTWLLGSAALVTSLWHFRHVGFGAGCLWLPLVLILPILMIVLRIRLKHRPSNVARCERAMHESVRALVEARPDLRLAVYVTPAGLRVLALHRTFDPRAEESNELLVALDSDPIYTRLCAVQGCFRARVSPKPWRIDITDHVPSAGVWPIRDEQRERRDAWVTRYETKAQAFAACRFVEVLGSGSAHPRALAVQRVHDEMSRARSGLPIA